MAGGSLNLKQVIGGAVIKQGDTNTKLGYELLDKNSGPMYSDIMSEGDNVSVTVVLTEVKKKASIVIDDATIKNGTVIFNMPAETTPGRYDIEMAISVKGQTAIFPSTYASVTLEITKSYLMGEPDDSEVKYVNIRDISNKVDKPDLETKLSTKADTTSLEPINESITKLEEDISNKVNKADFDVAMGSLTSKKDFEDFKTNFETEKEKLASKDEVVLKEVGKGLSDNNFDNQYKTKLDGLDQTFKDLVVDDLTSGGSDKALSAEQGKVLFNTIVKYHPPKVMTAVIDQANSNPLTCITYEDDAKMMEKGSPEWDDFFQSQLVLFKDGKEVRELEDSELNNLKPEDGDVMVRFPRKGLRIKTVGEKVYVSMTNKTDDPDYKYYAHSRGDSPRDAFYLGAYLGFEENGKLRSITGKAPAGDKAIGSFRTIAQANGIGYEQLAFYQWTFLQAMYVLKYGNLDSQTALGKGNTSGSAYDKATGETNGKGVDFGSTSDNTKVRFQWIEDFFGTKFQWCDGVKSNNNGIWINNDNFNDTGNGYKSYEGYDVYGQSIINSVIGDSERGFIPKSVNGSSSTYYCDYGYVNPADNKIASVGGYAGSGAKAGAFYFDVYDSASSSNSTVGARLMFL